MKLFDIATQKNLLLYLILPHFLKKRFLSQSDIEAIQKINRFWNVEVSKVYSAENYDAIHGYTQGEGSGYPLLQLLKHNFPSDRRLGNVLELGAGSGFLVSKLSNQSDSWTAVESSPVFIPRLVNLSRELSSHKIKVLERDIALLEPEENRFDTVFLFYTLHHLIERERVLEKIYRCLRKDGILYTLDPRHNLQRVIRIARKYFSSYRKNKRLTHMTTHDYVSKIELKELFNNTAFKQVEIQSFDFPLMAGLLGKNAERQFDAETIMTQIPIIEHFGRFIYSKATK